MRYHNLKNLIIAGITAGIYKNACVMNDKFAISIGTIGILISVFLLLVQIDEFILSKRNKAYEKK